MEVPSNVAFHLLIANVSKNVVHVPSRMVPCVFSDSMVTIIDPEHVDKECFTTLATVQAMSEQPGKKVCGNATSINEYWRDSTNNPPEHAVYRTSFANILQ